MGTMNIDSRLPAWMVAAGATVLVLMAVWLFCCIARDIAEMRVLWRAEDQPVKAAEEEKYSQEHELRRRKNRHGVDLMETDLSCW